MGATTLDTFYVTNTTLSGGNLVATSTGAGGARGTRPVSGLTYFEGVLTTLTGTPQIGIAASNWSRTVALGTGADTIGYQPSGVVRNNNVTIATLAAYVAGNSIGVAVDHINKLIWFRIGAGSWNNNALNNPVTGVGGIDFSAIAIPTIEAAVSATLTGNVWTMTFTPAFANAAPTGFQSLDTVAYSLVRSPLPSSMPKVPPVASLPASFGVAAYPLPLGQTTLGKQFSPAGPVTVVSGTTKEAGSIVTGKKVEVYDRITGDLLGCTYSDGSGNWSIAALGRPAVRVVGSDPTTYNSLVYDNVVPV